MKESDWKTFTKIKDKAIKKFCQLALDDFRKAMDDPNETINNRYRLNYELVQNRDKKMSQLFDGHSRSSAWLQLLSIRAKGLADETLLAKLSEDFLNKTDPKQFNR